MCSQCETHRQNGQQLMDGQLSPQSFFKRADGLMPQVVIGGDATVRQGLNAPIILEYLWKQVDKKKLVKWFLTPAPVR